MNSLAIDQLPGFLAIPYNHIFQENHAEACLHRISDAVEITTRFTFTLCISELRHARPDQPFTDKLRNNLYQSIERPTFGAWRNMLAAAINELDRLDHLVLPEIIDFTNEGLLPLVGTSQSRPIEGIISLRNELVHSGGIGIKASEHYLKTWLPRIESLVHSMLFLQDTNTYYLKNRKINSIHGLSADEQSAVPSAVFDDNDLTLLDGHIILVKARQRLDLWPLMDYDVATIEGPDARQAKSASPLVYFRAQQDKLLYAALGVEMPRAEKSDNLDSFRKIFSLDEETTVTAGEECKIDAQTKKNADALLNRIYELKKIHETILNSDNKTLLWIGGRPGIGKSALMAKLAVEFSSQPEKWFCIFWRFKLSDVGTRPHVFYEHAIKHLAHWGPLRNKKIIPVSEPKELMGQFINLLKIIDEVNEGSLPRILFLIDGMDEAARMNKDFVKMPISFRRNNIVWLCAGRPEPQVADLYKSKACVHVFDKRNGLPSMPKDGIRAMLLDGIDSLRARLVCRDVEQQTAFGVKIVNPVVEKLAECAAGLPLYVEYVIRDILAQHYNIGSFEYQDLPENLEDYYTVLIRRMNLGDLQATSTPVVILTAWACQPLPEELLIDFLKMRKLLFEPNAARTLKNTLSSLQSMLRRVATSDNYFGYEPYHNTFRDYIQEDKKNIFTNQNIATHMFFRDLALQWNTLEDNSQVQNYALKYGIKHIRQAQEYGLQHGIEDITKTDQVDLLEKLFTGTDFLATKLAKYGEVALFEDLDTLPESKDKPSRLAACLTPLLGAIKEHNKDDIRTAAHYINALAWIGNRLGVVMHEAYRLSAELYLGSVELLSDNEPKKKARMARNAAWNLMSAKNYQSAAQYFRIASSYLGPNLTEPDMIFRYLEHRVREIHCLHCYLTENAQLSNMKSASERLEQVLTETILYKKKTQKSSAYLDWLCGQLQNSGITFPCLAQCRSDFDKVDYQGTANPKAVVISNEYDLWLADILLDWLYRQKIPCLLINPEQFTNKIISGAERVYFFGGPKAPAIGKMVSDTFGEQEGFEKLYAKIDEEDGFGKTFYVDEIGRQSYVLVAGNDEETLDATLQLMRKLEPAHAVFHAGLS